jgi:hypothetical protein
MNLCRSIHKLYLTNNEGFFSRDINISYPFTAAYQVDTGSNMIRLRQCILWPAIVSKSFAIIYLILIYIIMKAMLSDKPDIKTTQYQIHTTSTKI